MSAMKTRLTEVEIDMDDIRPMSAESLAAALCTCHCQSCGIKLNLANSLDGRECMMCAIPMAANNNTEKPGIIATHY